MLYVSEYKEFEVISKLILRLKGSKTSIVKCPLNLIVKARNY